MLSNLKSYTIKSTRTLIQLINVNITLKQLLTFLLKVNHPLLREMVCELLNRYLGSIVVDRKDQMENQVSEPFNIYLTVFHLIHIVLGLPDPDPLVRGMDPDPSVIKQK
jgi:hypothetical protein